MPNSNQSTLKRKKKNKRDRIQRNKQKEQNEIATSCPPQMPDPEKIHEELARNIQLATRNSDTKQNPSQNQRNKKNKCIEMIRKKEGPIAYGCIHSVGPMSKVVTAELASARNKLHRVQEALLKSIHPTILENVGDYEVSDEVDLETRQEISKILEDLKTMDQYDFSSPTANLLDFEKNLDTILTDLVPFVEGPKKLMLNKKCKMAMQNAKSSNSCNTSSGSDGLSAIDWLEPHPDYHPSDDLVHCLATGNMQHYVTPRDDASMKSEMKTEKLITTCQISLGAQKIDKSSNSEMDIGAMDLLLAKCNVSDCKKEVKLQVNSDDLKPKEICAKIANNTNIVDESFVLENKPLQKFKFQDKLVENKTDDKFGNSKPREDAIAKNVAESLTSPAESGIAEKNRRNENISQNIAEDETSLHNRKNVAKILSHIAPPAHKHETLLKISDKKNTNNRSIERKKKNDRKFNSGLYCKTSIKQTTYDPESPNIDSFEDSEDDIQKDAIGDKSKQKSYSTRTRHSFEKSEEDIQKDAIDDKSKQKNNPIQTRPFYKSKIYENDNLKRNKCQLIFPKFSQKDFTKYYCKDAEINVEPINASTPKVSPTFDDNPREPSYLLDVFKNSPSKITCSYEIEDFNSNNIILGSNAEGNSDNKITFGSFDSVIDDESQYSVRNPVVLSEPKQETNAKQDKLSNKNHEHSYDSFSLFKTFIADSDNLSHSSEEVLILKKCIEQLYGDVSKIYKDPDEKIIHVAKIWPEDLVNGLVKNIFVESSTITELQNLWIVILNISRGKIPQKLFDLFEKCNKK